MVCDTIISETDTLNNITSLAVGRDEVNKNKIKTLSSEDGDEKANTLNSYIFTDSTLKAQKVFVWKANHYFNTVTLTKIDTLINENKTELPFYKKDVGVTYLGPTGSATMLHNFFLNTKSDIFPFFDPYSVYINKPENVVFYNTKVPFTDLAFSTSGSQRVSEDNLKVLFATNISPAWNFGILYHKYGAKGAYQNQGTRDKSFTAFTSYTGKRYVAHAGYIYNSVINRENGGILDDKLFVDTVLDAGAIDVKLKSAQNKLRNNTYFLTHSYGIPIELLNKNRDSSRLEDGGSMVYFGHSFDYSRYNRVYIDTPLDTATHYYKKFYLSNSSSFDSCAVSQLNNKVYMRLQPWSSNFWISNLDVGIGYQYENYYLFNPSYYLYGKYNDKHSTFYIYGGASGIFKKYFQWDGFMKYHFAGYRQHDLLLDVTARASVYLLPKGIHLTGRFVFNNKQPSFFYNNYFSNHFKWTNNFDKVQDTRVQLSLNIPDWDMEASFNNALINKPIYFDTDTLPKQSADLLNVTSITLQKNFKLGLFHFDHRLLMQFSSNNGIVPLPLFSANVTYYIQSEWVKSVLNSQVGFDVYYNTEFYDYAYNPGVGMFHLQNERKLGNYPWFDLFANFKWKRANIYVKLTNVFERIIGERDYFSALHYPRNNRMLRIGIRWLFFT